MMGKMRMFCLVIGVILIITAMAGCKGSVAQTQGILDTPQNIILIGWDGAQRNHVMECLDRDGLPNLKQLSNEGSLVAVDINRVTDTKAGWTQILTGYDPEITGVYSNSRYQPIPTGYSVFERLEKHFGPDNIATIAVIGKKGHVDKDGPKRIQLKKNETVDNIPKQEKPGGKLVTENGIKYYDIPGKPYYNTQNGMDLFLNGLGENPAVGEKALEFLEKYKDRRFFFFVHFADVDHKGHKYGENSKEYNDALISCDFWTGKIIQKLKELDLYEETLIYVTADHGFDEDRTGHSDAPYVFLGTNDKAVVRRGIRADITPTILDRFGVDLNEIKPALTGHPLTKPYKPPLWK